MKKNEIFTFTAPNGVEVTAVCVEEIGYNVRFGIATTTYLCYSQNRLFTYINKIDTLENTNDSGYGITLVEYCVIPEYDEMLEEYFHQLDSADDYADKTV